MRNLLFLLLFLPLFSNAQIGRLLKNKISTVDLKKGTELVSNHLRKTREKFDTTSFNYSVSFSDHSAQFEDKEKFDDVTNAASIYMDRDKLKSSLEEVREQIDLGEMYYATNAFKLAEASFIVALAALELNNYQADLMYPRVIADIGMLYNGMGRYDLALEFTNRALKIRKEVRGEMSIDYAASLNNLAVLHKNMGDFNEAEKAFTETLIINESGSGIESMPYAISLNNRGVLFQNLGRYPEAEKDLIKSLEIAAKNINPKTVKYARFQTNLGLLYQQEKKYDKAQEIFQSAISAVSRNPLNNKKTNPDYAHLLEINALLYVETGKYDEAESLFKEALAIYERKFGTNFSGYGLTNARLGALYRRESKFTEAENSLQRAEYILANTYGENHPHYVQVITELALLNWQLGNTQKANELFQKSINQSLVFVGKYFAPMSDVEKAAFWKTLRPRFEKYYAFASDVGKTNKEILKTALNYRLGTKAMLLSSTTKVKAEILNSGNKELIKDYNAWIDNKHQLALYYSMSKKDLAIQQVNTDSIEQITNRLEKELSQKSGIFNEAYSSQAPSLSDVQNNLRTGEAAVEIVRVGYALDGRLKYLVIVVLPDQIEMVVLSNGEQLETRYFKYYKNAIKLKREDTYSYDQFWKPIANKLGDANVAYLSSDGVYNQLSVNSLKNGNGSYVLDEIQLLNVSSLRSLVDSKAQKSTTKSAFLLGNPSYGSDKIDVLPGTGKEISTVSNILKSSGYRTSIYQTTEATEKVIKNIKSPKVMHIATHGFFVKDVTSDNSQVFSVPLNNVSENVLLRSGLILANAGNLNNMLGDDNGILTAYEAMNLDLSNTDLVVLSACETGLGDVMAGEGVYGLQRSFEIAGAKTVIMSLWKVDDSATQLLMTTFYRNWVSTKDKQKSFAFAQRKLKEKYPEPYYWGAFVLQGK
jgi:CHAT domain-containing protein/Tfp pilus assembly protein PilF